MTSQAIEQRNIDAVKQGIEWFNKRQLRPFINSIADDAVWRSQTVGLRGLEVHGRRGVTAMLKGIWQRLPGVQIDDLRHISASGDFVWCSYIMEAPAASRFLDQSASFPVRYHQAVVNVFRPDGLRTESIFYWSPLQVLAWMGMVDTKINPFGSPETD